MQTSVLDPYLVDQGPVCQKRGELWCYRVFLYLGGNHVPWVEFATYRLPPNFENPEQRVMRTVYNPLCRLEAWVWSEFPMTTEISLKTGEIFQISHDFRFAGEIQQKFDSVRTLPALSS